MKKTKQNRIKIILKIKLFAYICFNFGDACLAFDRATPLKFAFTFFFFNCFLNEIATATAQNFASVWTIRITIALSATSTKRANFRVNITIVRTLLNEYKVFTGRFAETFESGFQLLLFGFVFDFNSAVVFVFEIVANFSE